MKKLLIISKQLDYYENFVMMGYIWPQGYPASIRPWMKKPLIISKQLDY